MSQTLVVRTRSLDHEREEPTDPCRRIRRREVEKNGRDWQEWERAHELRILAEQARVQQDLARLGG